MYEFGKHFIVCGFFFPHPYREQQLYPLYRLLALGLPEQQAYHTLLQDTSHERIKWIQLCMLKTSLFFFPQDEALKHFFKFPHSITFSWWKGFAIILLLQTPFHAEPFIYFHIVFTLVLFTHTFYLPHSFRILCSEAFALKCIYLLLPSSIFSTCFNICLWPHSGLCVSA